MYINVAWKLSAKRILGGLRNASPIKSHATAQRVVWGNVCNYSGAFAVNWVAHPTEARS